MKNEGRGGGEVVVVVVKRWDGPRLARGQGYTL